MSLHYLVKYKCKKNNNNRQQVCWWTKYTSNQRCNEWSVQCYTLVDLFHWIFGIFNDMFVSGLCCLGSLPFHPQWSHSLQYVRASVGQTHAFGQCCMFPKSLLVTFPVFHCYSLSSKILSVLSKNCIFLNQYKFLTRALSPVLNGTLHHRYIVGALKIIIYDSIICFSLQTSEMYVKLNII